MCNANRVICCTALIKTRSWPFICSQPNLFAVSLQIFSCNTRHGCCSPWYWLAHLANNLCHFITHPISSSLTRAFESHLFIINSLHCIDPDWDARNAKHIPIPVHSIGIIALEIRSTIFFLRDFIFKKTLFEKLQYLKQTKLIALTLHRLLEVIFRSVLVIHLNLNVLHFFFYSWLKLYRTWYMFLLVTSLWKIKLH